MRLNAMLHTRCERLIIMVYHHTQLMVQQERSG